MQAFDTTRKVTYKNLPNWLKELREYRPEIPCLCAANKIDSKQMFLCVCVCARVCVCTCVLRESKRDTHKLTVCMCLCVFVSIIMCVCFLTLTDLFATRNVVLFENFQNLFLHYISLLFLLIYLSWAQEWNS